MLFRPKQSSTNFAELVESQLGFCKINQEESSAEAQSCENVTNSLNHEESDGGHEFRELEEQKSERGSNYLLSTNQSTDQKLTEALELLNETINAKLRYESVIEALLEHCE